MRPKKQSWLLTRLVCIHRYAFVPVYFPVCTAMAKEVAQVKVSPCLNEEGDISSNEQGDTSYSIWSWLSPPFIGINKISTSLWSQQWSF